MAEEYRFEGRKLTPEEMKAAIAAGRHGMREQDHIIRSRNFREVNLGYTAEMAMAEAKRCLLCRVPGCVKGCPVHIKIPEFLELVAEGDFLGALEVVHEDNVLPAITGRVCPQEVQCEALCTHVKAKRAAVGIGHLERFIADLERHSHEKLPVERRAPTGKRIAIVGAGPAGLTVAADLARNGHEVHMFEALQKPGGVLVYGIPEFRLPKEIIGYSVANLERMGVTRHMNHVIGRILMVDELIGEKGFDAVFLGVGAGLPRFMDIPGENLNGIYSANEYLTRSNLMKAYEFPDYDTPIFRGRNVAVIGGGNVAMDSVRTAVRLGAEHAYLVYRRSRAEMPAREEEIKHAEEEGVEFHNLTNPVRYLGNDDKWVVGMECIRMELGEPDDSGRRRPVPIEGSEFIFDVDAVVVAVGTSANPLLTKATPGLELNKWGNIVVDDMGRTSKRGVFAGGDIVRGAATVILAMGDGRTAAAAIERYLEDGRWPGDPEPACPGESKGTPTSEGCEVDPGE